MPATLVPERAALRTQESHPITLGGLSARNDRFDSRVLLNATPPSWVATDLRVVARERASNRLANPTFTKRVKVGIALF